MVLLGALDKASLDAQSRIGEILAAVVANLFLPIAARALPVEADQDGGAFGGCVNADATVAIVNLEDATVCE